MNRSIIQYILGYVLLLEGVLMGIPCITALCYRKRKVSFISLLEFSVSY